MIFLAKNYKTAVITITVIEVCSTIAAI